METKGINYDTGTLTTTNRNTRETFDFDIVTREIEIIKHELHCNAIRISGFDIERISAAAAIALKLGLTVWFSPSKPYQSQEDTQKFIIEGCRAAEKLRSEFSNIIFVVGCELSLFTNGFIKGETAEGRINNMFSPLSLVKNLIGIKRNYDKKLNDFLLETVHAIRGIFHGSITYASGTWEKIDWSMFDLIGIDYYRSAFNKKNFTSGLQTYKQLQKPLYITEFGCCSFKGAEDKGPMGWTIADWKKDTPTLKANYERSEQVQATYIKELLEIFNNENIEGTFVFTFVMYNYVHKNNPVHDMDMASYGIVKPIADKSVGYHQSLPWLPKLSFFDIANFYRNH